MRRIVPIALCLVLLGVATGCAEVIRTGDGRSATTDSGDVPRTTVPPRDPDIVLSAYTTGVGGDPGTLVPDFQLHKDGVVYLNGDQPLGIDTYRLSDAGVDKVLDLIADVPLSDDAYGELQVTDLSSTTVYLKTGDEAYGTQIYGLEYDDDLDMLDEDAAESRRRLRNALAELDEVSASAAAADSDLVAAPREPYTPDELDIVFRPITSDEESTLRDRGEDAVPWPLARPFATYPLRYNGYGSLCLTSLGADVTEAIRAVEDLDDPEPWATGARAGAGVPTHVVPILRPVVPGEDPPPTACIQEPKLTEIRSGELAPVSLVDPADWGGKFPADSFETANALEVYAATPILTTGLLAYDEQRVDRPDDSGLVVPTGSDLTWYEYEVAIAKVGEERYLDLEARRKTPADSTGRSDPQTWRARIDLAKERVVDVQLDP